MHSLYLCTAYIHIGSEEEIPIEYVVVEEENPQELPPEGEGQTSETTSGVPEPWTLHFSPRQAPDISLSFLSMF